MSLLFVKIRLICGLELRKYYVHYVVTAWDHRKESGSAPEYSIADLRFWGRKSQLSSRNCIV